MEVVFIVSFYHTLRTHATTKRRLQLRPVFTAAIALLLVFAFHVRPFPLHAQVIGGDNPLQAGYRLWSDPQFDIPLPAGWHPIEATWVAERLFFATPEPIDVSALLEDESHDLAGIIQVKIDALDANLRAIPLTELAEETVLSYRQILEEEGAFFQVVDVQTIGVGGHEGVVFETVQEDVRDHTLLVRTDDYLYEVRVMYAENLAEGYRPLADLVFSQFRLKKAVSTEDISVHSSPIGAVSLPSSWHMMTREGPIQQVYITRENLEEEGQYWAGASLIKLDQISAHFGLEEGAEIDPSTIYSRWFPSYVESVADSVFRLIRAEEISIQGRPSLVIELSLLDRGSGRFIQLVNVSTVIGESFYNATFEAPVEEYYQFQPVFQDAIESLLWR